MALVVHDKKSVYHTIPYNYYRGKQSISARWKKHNSNSSAKFIILQYKVNSSVGIKVNKKKKTKVNL